MDNLKLENFSRNLGTDFFGVADLTDVQAAIAEQGGSAVTGFPRAISVGISLFDVIVDQLPQRAENQVALDYRHHCYDVINQRLDIITSRVSSELQREGHKAFPIPASQRIDNERLCGIFSHKMAAHLAGLGWIGKSCLLITPERGPRVRWATVLTDAPIKPTGGPIDEKCGTCNLCVDGCPVKAFTGEPYRKNEPREVRYDASKCDRYFTWMKSKDSVPVCGICLYVCPYGRE